MLWLALYVPELPLQLFADEQHAQAFAISQRKDGREVIARCNSLAQQSGVRPGMSLPAALLVCAGLRVRARDLQREQQILQDLAQWAYQFSASISFDPLLLLLEIGASLRLFGGLPALLLRLQDAANGLDYDYRYAVAPTPMAASLLARTRPAVVVDNDQAMEQQVFDIPLSLLTRDLASTRLINDIGLNSIGDCLALPRAELARRSSPALPHLLDRLLGRQPDPRRFWRPPEYFRQRIEFLSWVDHQAALVFPAKRLIAALCGYLRGLGAATQLLHWRLEYRDKPASEFELGLLEASRDAGHLMSLFRERLERVQLPDSVVALGLQVDDCLPFRECSADLLLDKSRAGDQFLLERLASRLGRQRVRGMSSVADYRPERAWRLCEPGKGEMVAVSSGSCPPWLFEQPLPLRQTAGMPLYKGPLQLQPWPQRIESGWWDDFDVVRDYFIARSGSNERLWVFHDRRSGQWFLHGMFD